ncbi:hypothetical protein [Sediminibacillus halophilus]|uniref:Uncharacterized protein n=1 Tax=Sediminibacillus halophilus TaxID=482461 RepID=A0A1G9T9N6_9BACI|nr:hypothetical protein [Sediminibacillus halophilus]SDM44338.1 hypothetical protein SAMN05216244_2493 [Sediminibacillus halophilus]
MKFLKENEMTLVKALIYGFIAGVYYSILFVSQTKVYVNGNTRTFQEKSIFEYIVEVLQISVSVSIGATVLLGIYLHIKYLKKR